MISNDTEGRKKIKLLLIEQYLEQYVKILFLLILRNQRDKIN